MSCSLYGLAPCSREGDCLLPRLVIVLVFRPERLHLLVFEREISTLVMVVNLRGWERPALVVALVTDEPI